MKKYLILLIKIFNLFFLIFLFSFSLTRVLSLIKPQVKLEEEYSKLKEDLPIGEFQKQIIFSLPKESLKITLKIEPKRENPFEFQLAILKNDIYFKMPFGWQRTEIGEENLREIETLVNNLKEEQIFKKFERKEKEVEFLIDKEKLTKISFGFVKDEKLKEELLKMSDIGGKIFYNEKEEVEKIEIETEEKGKILIEFEKFGEKREDKNLENLILSLIK